MVIMHRIGTSLSASEAAARPEQGNANEDASVVMRLTLRSVPAVAASTSA